MLIERTRGSSWQTHVICIYHLLRLHIWFVNSCICVFGTDFPLNQLFLRHALEICGWNLNDLVWSYKWNKSILKSKERQRDLEQGCISLLVPLTHLLKVSYITFLSELRWYPVSSKTLYLEISRDIFLPILAVPYLYYKIKVFWPLQIVGVLQRSVMITDLQMHRRSTLLHSVDFSILVFQKFYLAVNEMRFRFSMCQSNLLLRPKKSRHPGITLKYEWITDTYGNRTSSPPCARQGYHQCILMSPASEAIGSVAGFVATLENAQS